MNEYLDSFWKDYVFIHNETKRLYILSEEYDNELSSFIQPIKEQRDSLEHIVRAYDRITNSGDTLSKKDEEYIQENLSKAKGHIFRAFFDCADILGITLREALSKNLKDFSYSKIISVWPEYENVRIKLVNMPNEFAKMRGEKDIAKGDQIVEMVHKYQNLITELFEIYNFFMHKVYQKLNK